MLECVRNLQQRLDNDKAHLLDQLEQMCSEDQVTLAAFALVYNFFANRRMLWRELGGSRCP